MISESRGNVLKEHTTRLLKQWHAEVRDWREKQEHHDPAQSPINRHLKSNTTIITLRNTPTSSVHAEVNPSEIKEEQVDDHGVTTYSNGSEGGHGQGGRLTPIRPKYFLVWA